MVEIKDVKSFDVPVATNKRGGSEICTTKKSCDFNFTVKWDWIGFYIHLFEFDSVHVTTYAGCRFHTCCPFKNEMFRDSYGVFEVDSMGNL